jgi:exodeoxyribonuclease VII small subunit
MQYFSVLPVPRFPSFMAKTLSSVVTAAASATSTFESALQELEGIVQAMEAGNAPLDQALAAYERGIALLRQCQQTLVAAEGKLKILEDGVLREFDPDSAAGAGD